MVCMDRNVWSDKLIETAGPSIRLSIVGYDGHCAACARVARSVGMLLDESLERPPGIERERLSDILPIRPIDPDAPSVAIGEMVAHAASAETWNRVEQHGPPTKTTRADGHQLLQAYLILPARYLQDDGDRSRLIKALSECSDELAAYTILFLGDVDGMVVHDLDHDRACQWIIAFDSLSPRRVAAYYVGLRLDSGRPIPIDEVADSLAVAVVSDLLCPAHSPEQTLTFLPGDDMRTLGTLGARVIRFSPLELASSMAGYATISLMEATLLDGAQQVQDLSPESLAPAPAVLDRALVNSPLKRLSLRLSDALPDKNNIDRPVIIGVDHHRSATFAAGVDFKTQGFKLHLDDLPRTQWLDALYEWDFIHRREVIHDWLDGVDQAFEATAVQLGDEVDQLLLRHIREYPRLDLAAQSVRQLARIIREVYHVDVQPGKTPDLDASLTRLRGALASIPHAPTLLLRAMTVVLLQGLIAWTFWSRSLPYASIVTIALATLAVLTAGWAAWGHLSAVRRAHVARNQAAEDIESRCGLLAVRRIASGMCKLRDLLAERLEVVAALVDGMDGSVRRDAVTVDADSRPKSDPVVYRLLPSQRDIERLYAEFTQRELACRPDGIAVTLAQRIIAEEVGRAIGQRSDTSTVMLSRLQELAADRLTSFFFDRRLTDFLRLPQDRSDVLADEHLMWLTQRAPPGRFFLEGHQVALCASASHEPVERLLMTGALAYFESDNPSLPVHRSAMRNVAARIARVELARAAGTAGGGGA